MGQRVLLGLTGLLLAGCAHRPIPPRVAVAPPPIAAVVPPPVAPTPINAGLTPAATLWHLRAGLNVAALACRGSDEAVIAAGYNALLAGRAATLKAAEAAYAAQFAAQKQAGGGDWRHPYDDAMTRLYNFWGQARGRAEFCRTAVETLRQVEGVPDAALPEFAAARLTLLDRPFAPPRLAVDARVFSGPATTMVAAR